MTGNAVPTGSGLPSNPVVVLHVVPPGPSGPLTSWTPSTPEPARAEPARRYGGEPALRSIGRAERELAPAGRGAVDTHPAPVIPLGDYLGELPPRRVQVHFTVPTPAGQGLVGSDPARVHALLTRAVKRPGGS